MDTSEDGGVRVEVLMIQLSDHYLIWCATKMLIFIHIEKIKGIYCGVFFYREKKSGLVP